MLVSWTWLSRYLELKMEPAELVDALSLSGLNHEGTETVNGEVVIDLEVTSNRGDCLGHLGVAREIAVLYDIPMSVPEVTLKEGNFSVDECLSVRNEFEDACPRYTARVIRGCKVVASPKWLADSLTAIGITPINNIVDVTNYVMMECGQPLHAFDLAQLRDTSIVVRPASKGEELEAIDHKTYTLDESMCVIADAQRASAVAGVMGGAFSEVQDTTKDIVIEAAIFTPMSVRKTARALKLHSPSSYRFERRVDPVGVDWASRRACQLIQETAGGEVARGVIDTAPEIPGREPVVLRLSQIERVLGIEVDRPEVVRILSALGCEATQADESMQVLAPSWRHDLTREADLIEEVARIHGYDKIPEDSPVPVEPSAKRDFDVGVEKIRQVMIAAGISEAMTPSVVTEQVDLAISPWSNRPALLTRTPLLKGANRLRRTLIPSLLQCRANNWSAGNIAADLYEVAHIYLPGEGEGALPDEQYSLSFVSGCDYFTLKGIVETLLRSIGCKNRLEVQNREVLGLDGQHCVSLHLGDKHVGFLGTVDGKLVEEWKLPGQTSVAELALPLLMQDAELVPQYRAVSPFPTISRDLNLVVNETIRWVDLEASTRGAVGVELVGVHYRETYRAPEKDGEGTKRVLFSVDLQRQDATLTGGEAESMIGAIVQRCEKDHGARLLA